MAIRFFNNTLIDLTDMSDEELSSMSTNFLKYFRMDKEGQLYEGRYRIYQFKPIKPITNIKTVLTNGNPVFCRLAEQQRIKQRSDNLIEFKFKIKYKDASGQTSTKGLGRSIAEYPSWLMVMMPRYVDAIINFIGEQEIINMELHTKSINPDNKCVFCQSGLSKHRCGSCRAIPRGECDEELDADAASTFELTNDTLNLKGSWESSP